MKKRKIINWITALSVISAIIISSSFISERIKDYQNMTKAVSSSVSYIETPKAEKKPEKYEQIIAEQKKKVPELKKEDTEVSKYVMPATGDIIAEYNENEIVYLDETGDYRTHKGIDIRTDGNAVMSIADGLIYDIYEDYNNYYVLIIKHDEITSVYKNIIINSELNVGKNVKKGDILGKGVLSEKHGEYVHFEIINEGKNDNPIKYFQ